MLALKLEGVRNAPREGLDAISRALWLDYSQGRITDEEAAEIDAAVRARMQGGRRPIANSSRPRKAPCRSPDRHASLLRKRRLAASGPIPPVEACHYTPGQLAVVAIIVGEVAKKGVCTLFVDEIGAKAGVSATVVRQTLRTAIAVGHFNVVRERPARCRNLPNAVRIVSPEIQAWLRRGRQHFRNAHEQQEFKKGREKGRKARNGPTGPVDEQGRNGAADGGGGAVEHRRSEPRLVHVRHGRQVLDRGDRRDASTNVRTTVEEELAVICGSVLPA